MITEVNFGEPVAFCAHFSLSNNIFFSCSKDENAALVNGNRDSLPFDGMADAEVERRMKVCAF